MKIIIANYESLNPPDHTSVIFSDESYHKSPFFASVRKSEIHAGQTKAFSALAGPLNSRFLARAPPLTLLVTQNKCGDKPRITISIP